MSWRRWIAEKILRVPVGMKIVLLCDEANGEVHSNLKDGLGWTLTATGGSLIPDEAEKG